MTDEFNILKIEDIGDHWSLLDEPISLEEAKLKLKEMQESDEPWLGLYIIWDGE